VSSLMLNFMFSMLLSCCGRDCPVLLPVARGPRGQTPLYHSWGLVSSTSLLWERVRFSDRSSVVLCFRPRRSRGVYPVLLVLLSQKRGKERRRGDSPEGFRKTIPPSGGSLSEPGRSSGPVCFVVTWVWKEGDPRHVHGLSPLVPRAVGLADAFQVRLGTCSCPAKHVPWAAKRVPRERRPQSALQKLDWFLVLLASAPERVPKG
jgi:hypothetical protein